MSPKHVRATGATEFQLRQFLFTERPLDGARGNRKVGSTVTVQPKEYPGVYIQGRLTAESVEPERVLVVVV